MATINEIQDEIIEEFSGFDDWMDRYAYIIDLGNALEPLDEQFKTPEYLIEGCQSRVWIHAEAGEGGTVTFTADSDAIITKGIISLLIGIYSGRTPQEIAGSDFSFIEKIGLKENLSPTRANGLASMIAVIKAAAIANV